jgi:hypothetical protein
MKEASADLATDLVGPAGDSDDGSGSHGSRPLAVRVLEEEPFHHARHLADKIIFNGVF